MESMTLRAGIFRNQSSMGLHLPVFITKPSINNRTVPKSSLGAWAVVSRFCGLFLYCELDFFVLLTHALPGSVSSMS